MSSHYDAIIIGAGMSGLAAGIRLAMFDKKVCILESHSIPGGLNSYYHRKKKRLDVGLHALTNFVPKGKKNHPLTKLLRQLRISYDDLELQEQHYSLISFPKLELSFTNNINHFTENIIELFPQEIDNFHELLNKIKTFNELSLENEYESARSVVQSHIKEKQLEEMIFAPLLIYGSAWEHDMDFSQFVIMFKSIFLEGFSRPKGGVKPIIDLLLKKYSESGGEIQFKKKVAKILSENNKITGVELSSGERITANMIFSSAGLPETYSLAKLPQENAPRPGRMSFCEVILYFDKPPKESGINETIVFKSFTKN